MPGHFGSAGKPDRTATHVHQRWFNIVDLHPQPPLPPLPSIPALVPVPETVQIVSNKFYNRLHVLLTTLLGTHQHSSNGRLRCQHHHLALTGGVVFDYRGR